MGGKDISGAGGIRRIGEDGRDALGTLYRRHADWLKRALSARLRARHGDVEDLVQETYLRVARYAPAEAERHPRALLLRIAVNLARDDFRRAAVRQSVDGHVPANDTAPLGEVRGSEPEQEYLLLLKQVVLDLPKELRDVFMLSRFTGMTNADIARHLGISVKTVEWRMGKALALCAARLRD